MHYKQLGQISFFRYLDASLLATLASSSSIKSYDKGQMLFIHGDSIRYFYIINSGWVKLFRDTLDGQEALLGLSKSGDMIGEVNLNERTHLFSAQAVNKVEILLLPYGLLIDNIKNNLELALIILKSLNTTIELLELQIEHSSTMNAPKRIACFILRLCDKKKGKVQVQLPYEKMLIASYLGMKRETFSRGLYELELQGVRVDGNIIYIEDIDDLIEFCCISCSLSYDSC